MTPLAKSMSALLFAATIAVSVAGGGIRAEDDNDHELARRALAEGKIRPLADILAALAKRVPGEVIEVDLDYEQGRFTYEIKVLTPEGKVMEAELDARDARVVAVEEEDDD